MSKNYLIKRNPGFTNSGVIIKRKSKNKGYSETVITDQRKKPASSVLKIGDTIFVAETEYGIYAKGKVTNISEIIVFNSTEETLNYIINEGKKDYNYWMDKLIRLQKGKILKPKKIIKYQEYFIDQELLDRTIPLIGKLKRIGLPGNASSVILLSDEEVEYIKEPMYDHINELDSAIPSNLRMDIYNMLNKNYAIEHWIDIDHFVPKSTLGPGNIIENLVPVGLSLNRYKSNSVPRGLFKEANKYYELKTFVQMEFLNAEDEFLRKSKYPKAIDHATKINQHIINHFDIDMAKKFYKNVLQEHFPKYVEILDKL